MFGSKRLVLALKSQNDEDQVRALVSSAHVANSGERAATKPATVEVPVKNLLDALDLLDRIRAAGVTVTGFDLHSRTLDEVFLSLTDAARDLPERLSWTWDATESLVWGDSRSAVFGVVGAREYQRP